MSVTQIKKKEKLEAKLKFVDEEIIPSDKSEVKLIKTEKKEPKKVFVTRELNPAQKEQAIIVANSLMGGLENPKCRICHWTFQTFGDLKDHLVKHVSHPFVEIDVDSRDACCIFCQVLIRRTSMRTHVQLKHEKETKEYFKLQQLNTKNSGTTCNPHSGMKQQHTAVTLVDQKLETKSSEQSVKANTLNSSSPGETLNQTVAKNISTLNSNGGNSKDMPYPFTCSFCFKGYFTNGKLSQHIKISHPWINNEDENKYDEYKGRKRKLKPDSNITQKKIRKESEADALVLDSMKTSTTFIEKPPVVKISEIRIKDAPLKLKNAIKTSNVNTAVQKSNLEENTALNKKSITVNRGASLSSRKIVRPGKPPKAFKNNSDAKEQIESSSNKKASSVEVKSTVSNVVGLKVNNTKDNAGSNDEDDSAYEEIESESESIIEEETDEEIVESSNEEDAGDNKSSISKDSPPKKSKIIAKFDCPHCRIGFPCQTELNSHLTVHDNPARQERFFNLPYPYVCVYCGCGCYRKYNLRQHLQSKHTLLYKPDLEKDEIFVNHAIGIEQDYEKSTDVAPQPGLPKRDRSKFNSVLEHLKTGGRVSKKKNLMEDEGKAEKKNKEVLVNVPRTSGRKRNTNEDVLNFLQKKKKISPGRTTSKDDTGNVKATPEVKKKATKIDSIKKTTKKSLNATKDLEESSSSGREEEEENSDADTDESMEESDGEETESSSDEEEESHDSEEEESKSSQSDSDDTSSSDESHNSNSVKSLQGESICKYCDVILTSKRVVQHEKCHFKQLPKNAASNELLCIICKKTMARHELKWHMHKKHASLQRIKLSSDKKYCPKCNFCSKKHLEDHIKNEHKELLKIECRLCDDRFSTQGHYKKHFQETHAKTIDEDTLECLPCNKKFRMLSQLHHHYSITHMMKNESLFCALCSKYFYNKTGLDNHEEEFHKNDKFQCGLCLLELCDVKKCESHVKTHKKMTDFKCNSCNFYFESIEILEKHSTTHVPQVCTVCNKVFLLLVDYNKHLLSHSIPDDCENLTCSICKKTMANKAELKKHEKTHSVNSYYSCSSCDRVFESLNDIREHMDEVHHGGARAGIDINEHMDENLVTAPTVNECAECGETFLRTDIFLEHKKKHANASLTCSNC